LSPTEKNKMKKNKIKKRNLKKFTKTVDKNLNEVSANEVNLVQTTQEGEDEGASVSIERNKRASKKKMMTGSYLI
jgi:hypothetical protein